MVIGTKSESSLYSPPRHPTRPTPHLPRAPEIGPAGAHTQPRSNAPHREGVITGAQGGHSPMGAGPRLETKLQPGPSEDTRRPFDARQALRPRRAWISVFTVSPILYRRFFFLFFKIKSIYFCSFFQNSPFRMCCCSDVSGQLTRSLEVKKNKK